MPPGGGGGVSTVTTNNSVAFGHTPAPSMSSKDKKILEKKKRKSGTERKEGLLEGHNPGFI